MSGGFTAGPWHRNIKPARRYPVVFAGRNTHVAIICTEGLTDAEIEANCNLITAAPSMFGSLAPEALEGTADEIEATHPHRAGVLRMIARDQRAAIKKVED
jgi:hypothetical protein